MFPKSQNPMSQKKTPKGILFCDTHIDYHLFPHNIHRNNYRSLVHPVT